MLRAMSEGRASRGRPFAPGNSFVHRVDCACSRCDLSTKKRVGDIGRKHILARHAAGKNPAKRGAATRIAWERREAARLVDDGYQVFSPYAVCDRVAVKDGKVFLVEFKQPRQKLLPAQQLVKDLLPENYVVIFSKCAGVI